MCPVAVPEKIIGLTLFLDFFDRGHSLRSLFLPPAALPSLPHWRFAFANVIRWRFAFANVTRWRFAFANVTRWRFVCIFFRKRKKIMVATSVCTGGSNSPPDCCIYIIRISIVPHKKARIPEWVSVLIGDPLEIRTPDPLLKRQLLCQLS